MAKQIVFIHGIDRKPPLDLYTSRLRATLEESVQLPIAADGFHVAYWTKAIQPGRKALTAPEDEYVSDDNRSVNFRPYSVIEAVKLRAAGAVKGAVTANLEDRLTQLLTPSNQGDSADIVDEIRRLVASFISNDVAARVYERFVQDVDRYFNQGRRADVKRVLQKTLDIPESDSVCLIAHSMGSVIALDVILEGTRTIDRLITIGSPIGVSVLQKEIGVTDANRSTLPDRISSWFNFFDQLDCVAIDSDLEDDFPEIQPFDQPIRNEFVIRAGDERNHHKSYGYLRSPEVGEVVRDFLER